MTNLQWSFHERQMLWAPLFALWKTLWLTNIHPVDMQRGDAFWGVAVQDHRISVLHIQRLDFLFGEFRYTCTKKAKKFLCYWYLLKFCLLLFPWYVFNKIFPFTSSFAFSAFNTNLNLHRETMSFTQSRKSLRSGTLTIGIPSFTKFLEHPLQSQALDGDV